MTDDKFRLTETDHYSIGELQGKAVLMTEMSDEKEDIRVVVAPDLGMSLVEFSLGNTQILQNSRKEDFVHGRKGLGPLILPHFNERTRIPVLPVDLMKIFDHIDYLEQHNVNDPFQHGIGRYVGWKYRTEITDTSVSVTGFISGGDPVGQDIVLRDITGFDFQASVTYKLADRNLDVAFDVQGEQPVACGIHFYYAVSDPEHSQVTMSVEEIGIEEEDSFFEFSEHQREGKFYRLDLDRDLDTTFIPKPVEKDRSVYKLETPDYRLDTHVKTRGNGEDTFDSVVVFHPEGSDFVCVEPISAEEGTRPTRKTCNGVITLHPITGGTRL